MCLGLVGGELLMKYRNAPMCVFAVFSNWHTCNWHTYSPPKRPLDCVSPHTTHHLNAPSAPCVSAFLALPTPPDPTYPSPPRPAPTPPIPTSRYCGDQEVQAAAGGEGGRCSAGYKEYDRSVCLQVNAGKWGG